MRPLVAIAIAIPGRSYIFPGCRNGLVRIGLSQACKAKALTGIGLQLKKRSIDHASVA
jgi:hypothetical protein